MVAPGVKGRRHGKVVCECARGVLPVEGLWLGPTLPQGIGTRDPVPGQAKLLSAVRPRRSGLGGGGGGPRSPHQWWSTSLIR